MSHREQGDLELKKHVASIHCSNTLSLLQRKISNVLLYHAYDELLQKEEHSITLKQLCTLIGYSSHDYDSIKRALKALISTVLEWNLLGDTKSANDEDWNASSILASVGIRSGVCTYAYSNRLKKLLHMPEMYGRINIAVQAKFKSNYGLALYENCVRYQNLPHTRWFTLATFRKLMGVPEDKYLIFRDFKRRVLDKSVAEINCYADLHIQPEIERGGHTVNRIRFKLNPKFKTTQPPKPQKMKVTGSFIKEQLQEIGCTQQQAATIARDYDHTKIDTKIRAIKLSSSFTQGKIQNPIAYLKQALSEDADSYKAGQFNDRVAQTVVMDEDDLKRGYFEAVGETLDTTFENFDPALKTQLLETFECDLRKQNNVFVLEKYYQRSLTNRIVKSLFHTFLREHYAKLLPTLETFEQFVLKQKKL